MNLQSAISRVNLFRHEDCTKFSTCSRIAQPFLFLLHLICLAKP